MANVVFVAATSTAYPTITGKATVAITQPQPWVSWTTTAGSITSAGLFTALP